MLEMFEHFTGDDDIERVVVEREELGRRYDTLCRRGKPRDTTEQRHRHVERVDRRRAGLHLDEVRREPALPTADVEDGTCRKLLDKTTDTGHEVLEHKPRNRISRDLLAIRVSESLGVHRWATTI